MPEKIAKPSYKPTGDRLIEHAISQSPASEPAASIQNVTPKEAGGQRPTVFQKLGKLKPLLPVLSGGLRMIDHGAVQAIAQLIHFIDGSTAAQAAAQEDLHVGLSEIQTGHRELGLQVQDQTVQIRRIEEQIGRLRISVERNAAEQAELMQNMKSLGNLVRAIGAGLAILLIVLLVLTSFLLIHRG
jgi:hypothetical protein